MKLTDDQILEAVARLYADIDPPPGDLADGVLARLAVDGLEMEYELLTLVERVDHAAGTRGATAAENDAATVALEFAGASYRVLVRISTVDGQRRLDGWIVPAVPMRIFVGPHSDAVAHARQRADADDDGRFEFVDSPRGELRLWLLPQPGADAAVTAFVTPPFVV
ncbi:MAG: hypothetical protein WB797_02770 [Nocardioides sp.]